ncbi:outer membrane beta-barrel protein [Leptobacterium flavescens]|uniref:Outer membrane beta-barrel protein n=1 Tax=Leptobacterium flavescens TaxID=472055 RepID=A0A6P0UL39_9FLAO|nr:porin family protein [Leptobacterium flavescens]NER14081.1 outer membrane beta-barrel protein [Leptobacterium flavescens]
MKKLLMLALATVGFISFSNAQSAKFGVKAGANFSNLKIDTALGGGSPDGATSFYVGALVDLAVSDKFHIQPEALYSIEGADDADITFIDIPVMAKLYIIDGLNVQAGPQFGIVVDADGGTDGLKTTNFSLNLGAAYEFPGGFFADGRYNFGLSDISDVDGIELNTKGLQLGIGYRF